MSLSSPAPPSPSRGGLHTNYGQRLRSPGGDSRERRRPRSSGSGFTGGVPPRAPSASPSRPSGTVYSDRYIPSRTGSSLENGFSIIDSSPGGKHKKDQGSSAASSTGEGTKEGFSTYSMLLKNELLGVDSPSPRHETKPGEKEGGVAQVSPSRNLFRFKAQRQQALDETQAGFSLSPVGQASQRLLSSPRKAKRKIAKVPFKVLDAPALQDDFYLNLVDWSSLNVLAVGLGSCVYLWSACTSKVTKLCDLGPDDCITSVSWTQRGTHLAVGTNTGEVQIWDSAKCKKIRTMEGHSARVGTMAWNNHVLASGSRDRLIYQRDVRVPEQFISKLVGHKQEVCGLKWSFDDQQLASGGNDNKLFIWNAASPNPVLRFNEHTAAVKAIAWSPHQHGLLASGGGTADRCIRFVNTLTGTPLNCIDTGSQVCNLMWSRNINEVVSTHGYSLNQIIIWRYPSMTKVQTLTGHTYRVLYLAMSPDGQTVVTGAGDETLRFWNVFPGPKNKDGSRLGTSLLFPSGHLANIFMKRLKADLRGSTASARLARDKLITADDKHILITARRSSPFSEEGALRYSPLQQLQCSTTTRQDEHSARVRVLGCRLVSELGDLDADVAARRVVAHFTEFDTVADCSLGSQQNVVEALSCSPRSAALLSGVGAEATLLDAMSVISAQSSYRYGGQVDRQLHLLRLAMGSVLRLHHAFVHPRAVEDSDTERAANVEEDRDEEETKTPRASDTRPVLRSESHVPLNAEIGLKLFFRLVKTLRLGQNRRTLLAMVAQLPDLLADMPPLGLSDALSAVDTNHGKRPLEVWRESGHAPLSHARHEMSNATALEAGGVVNALSEVLEEALRNSERRQIAAAEEREELKLPSTATLDDSLRDAFEVAEAAGVDADAAYAVQASVDAEGRKASFIFSSDEKASVLSAMVGLAIKRGTLPCLLRAVALLLRACPRTGRELDESSISHIDRSDGKLMLSVAPYLMELAGAAPTTAQQNVKRDNSSGTLVSFGKGDHGKLGHGRCTHSHCSEGYCTENVRSPKIVEGLAGLQIEKIASLSTHSVAVTTDGRLYSWGNGDKNRLGHGSTAKEYAPRLVQSLRSKPPVKDVACGLGHTLALLVNGQVYSWGNGGNGRLGLGDTEDRASACLVTMVSSPTMLQSLDTTTTGTTTAATSSAAAAVNQGVGASVGNFSETCSPLKPASSRVPCADATSYLISAVFCGASHSLAVSVSGHFFAWGKNNQGQCGHGEVSDQLLPRIIQSIGAGASTGTSQLSQSFSTMDADAQAGYRGVMMAGGWEHTLALTADGRLFSFGSGYKDSRRTGLPPVLGHSGTDRELIPRQILALSDEFITHCACGWDHSMAVTEEGALYTWGAGSNGKLGHGDEAGRPLPQRVETLADVHVVQAEAGCEHSVAVSVEGHVYTWGHGDSGRLGHGDNRTEKRPRRISSSLLDSPEHSVVAVAVGDKYNLMLIHTPDQKALLKIGQVAEADVDGMAEQTTLSMEENGLAADSTQSSDELGFGSHKLLKIPTLQIPKCDSPFEDHEKCSGAPEKLDFNDAVDADEESADFVDREACVAGLMDRYAVGVVILAHIERLVSAYMQNSCMRDSAALKETTLDDSSSGAVPLDNGATMTKTKSPSKAVVLVPGAVPILGSLARRNLGPLGNNFTEDDGGNSLGMVDMRSRGRSQPFLSEEVSSPPSRPYAIDTSNASFEMLLNLLLRAAKIAEHSVDAIRTAEVGQISKSDTSLVFEGNVRPALWWSILWCCLRILQVNLRFQIFSASTSGDAFLLNDLHATFVPDAFKFKLRAVLSSVDDERDFYSFIGQDLGDWGKAGTMLQLHALLLRIVMFAPSPTSTVHGTDSSKSLSQEIEREAALHIQREAAATLQVGFRVFYPTPESRLSLFNELFEMSQDSQPSRLIFSTLLGELARDAIMCSVLSVILPGVPQAFRRSHSHDDSVRSTESENVVEATAKDGIAILDNLMNELLRRCEKCTSTKLENAIRSSSGKKTCSSVSGASFSAVNDGEAVVFQDDVCFRILLSMQTQAMAHWGHSLQKACGSCFPKETVTVSSSNIDASPEAILHAFWCRADPCSGECGSDQPSIHSVMLLHAERVFQCCSDLLSSVEATIRQAVSSDVRSLERLDQALQCSTAAMLLPALAGELVLLPPHPSVLVRLIPPVIRLTLILDTLCAIVAATSLSTPALPSTTLRASPFGWLPEIAAPVSLLSSKLCCGVVAGGPHCGATELALRPWLTCPLLSGGLSSVTNASSSVPLNPLASLLSWEGISASTNVTSEEGIRVGGNKNDSISTEHECQRPISAANPRGELPRSRPSINLRSQRGGYKGRKMSGQLLPQMAPPKGARLNGAENGTRGAEAAGFTFTSAERLAFLADFLASETSCDNAALALDASVIFPGAVACLPKAASSVGTNGISRAICAAQRAVVAVLLRWSPDELIDEAIVVGRSKLSPSKVAASPVSVGLKSIFVTARGAVKAIFEHTVALLLTKTTLELSSRFNSSGEGAHSNANSSDTIKMKNQLSAANTAARVLSSVTLSNARFLLSVEPSNGGSDSFLSPLTEAGVKHGVDEVLHIKAAQERVKAHLSGLLEQVYPVEEARGPSYGIRSNKVLNIIYLTVNCVAPKLVHHASKNQGGGIGQFYARDVFTSGLASALAFVSTPICTETLRNMMVIRSKRAEIRVVGLSVLRQLLSRTRVCAVRSQIVRCLPYTLCGRLDPTTVQMQDLHHDCRLNLRSSAPTENEDGQKKSIPSGVENSNDCIPTDDAESAAVMGRNNDVEGLSHERMNNEAATSASPELLGRRNRACNLYGWSGCAHWLSNIEACDLREALRVRTSLVRLYECLTALLKDPLVETEMRLAVIQSLACRAHPCERFVLNALRSRFALSQRESCAATESVGITMSGDFALQSVERPLDNFYGTILPLLGEILHGDGDILKLCASHPHLSAAATTHGFGMNMGIAASTTTSSGANVARRGSSARSSPTPFDYRSSSAASFGSRPASRSRATSQGSSLPSRSPSRSPSPSPSISSTLSLNPLSIVALPAMNGASSFDVELSTSIGDIGSDQGNAERRSSVLSLHFSAWRLLQLITVHCCDSVREIADSSSTAANVALPADPTPCTGSQASGAGLRRRTSGVALGTPLTVELVQNATSIDGGLLAAVRKVAVGELARVLQALEASQVAQDAFATTMHRSAALLLLDGKIDVDCGQDSGSSQVKDAFTMGNGSSSVTENNGSAATTVNERMPAGAHSIECKSLPPAQCDSNGALRIGAKWPGVVIPEVPDDRHSESFSLTLWFRLSRSTKMINPTSSRPDSTKSGTDMPVASKFGTSVRVLCLRCYQPDYTGTSSAARTALESLYLYPALLIHDKSGSLSVELIVSTVSSKGEAVLESLCTPLCATSPQNNAPLSSTSATPPTATGDVPPELPRSIHDRWIHIACVVDASRSRGVPPSLAIYLNGRLAAHRDMKGCALRRCVGPFVIGTPPPQFLKALFPVSLQGTPEQSFRSGDSSGDGLSSGTDVDLSIYQRLAPLFHGNSSFSLAEDRTADMESAEGAENNVQCPAAHESAGRRGSMSRSCGPLLGAEALVSDIVWHQRGLDGDGVHALYLVGRRMDRHAAWAQTEAYACRIVGLLQQLACTASGATLLGHCGSSSSSDAGQHGPHAVSLLLGILGTSRYGRVARAVVRLLRTLLPRLSPELLPLDVSLVQPALRDCYLNSLSACYDGTDASLAGHRATAAVLSAATVEAVGDKGHPDNSAMKLLRFILAYLGVANGASSISLSVPEGLLPMKQRRDHDKNCGSESVMKDENGNDNAAESKWPERSAFTFPNNVAAAILTNNSSLEPELEGVLGKMQRAHGPEMEGGAWGALSTHSRMSQQRLAIQGELVALLRELLLTSGSSRHQMPPTMHDWNSHVVSALSYALERAPAMFGSCQRPSTDEAVKGSAYSSDLALAMAAFMFIGGHVDTSERLGARVIVPDLARGGVLPTELGTVTGLISRSSALAMYADLVQQAKVQKQHQVLSRGANEMHSSNTESECIILGRQTDEENLFEILTASAQGTSPFDLLVPAAAAAGIAERSNRGTAAANTLVACVRLDTIDADSRSLGFHTSNSLELSSKTGCSVSRAKAESQSDEDDFGKGLGCTVADCDAKLDKKCWKSLSRHVTDDGDFAGLIWIPACWLEPVEEVKSLDAMNSSPALTKAITALLPSAFLGLVKRDLVLPSSQEFRCDKGNRLTNPALLQRLQETIACLHLRRRSINALATIAQSPPSAVALLECDKLFGALLSTAVSDVSSVARRTTLSCVGTPAVSAVVEGLTDAILPRTLEIAAERLWQRLQGLGRSALLRQLGVLDAALGGDQRSSLSQKISGVADKQSGVPISSNRNDDIGCCEYTQQELGNMGVIQDEQGLQMWLASMGGDVQVDHMLSRVKALSNFPSVRVRNIGGLALKCGCWHYEVELLTDGLMQIGWADAAYKGDPTQGQGIGDHPHSWAYDGYRCRKWNGEYGSEDYGLPEEGDGASQNGLRRWRAGDIVGCSVDTDTLVMRFSVNGESLGIAYSDFHSVGGIFPAVSLNMGQEVRFKFGPPYSTFAYWPPPGIPSEEVSSYRPVSEAGAAGALSLSARHRREGGHAGYTGVDGLRIVDPTGETPTRRWPISSSIADDDQSTISNSVCARVGRARAMHLGAHIPAGTETSAAERQRASISRPSTLVAENTSELEGYFTSAAGSNAGLRRIGIGGNAHVGHAVGSSSIASASGEHFYHEDAEMQMQQIGSMREVHRQVVAAEAAAAAAAVASQQEEVSERLSEDGDDEAHARNIAMAEAELQRQRMVDALLSMGFPVQWCMRAADHPSVRLDESTAIAWIIEQMELQEEAGAQQQVRGSPRGSNNDDGDEQERLDELDHDELGDSLGDGGTVVRGGLHTDKDDERDEDEEEDVDEEDIEDEHDEDEHDGERIGAFEEDEDCLRRVVRSEAYAALQEELRARHSRLERLDLHHADNLYAIAETSLSGRHDGNDLRRDRDGIVEPNQCDEFESIRHRVREDEVTKPNPTSAVDESVSNNTKNGEGGTNVEVMADVVLALLGGEECEVLYNERFFSSWAISSAGEASQNDFSATLGELQYGSGGSSCPSGFEDLQNGAHRLHNGMSDCGSDYLMDHQRNAALEAAAKYAQDYGTHYLMNAAAPPNGAQVDGNVGITFQHPILALVETCDPVELWGMSAAVESALAVLYARAAVVAILRHAVPSPVPPTPLPHSAPSAAREANAANMARIVLPQLLLNALASPKLCVMVLDLLRLVLFRGPTICDVGVGAGSRDGSLYFVTESAEIFEQNQTNLTPSSSAFPTVCSEKKAAFGKGAITLVVGQVARMELPLANALLAIMRLNAEVVSGKSLSSGTEKESGGVILRTLLLEEAVAHFKRAAVRDFDRVFWGSGTPDGIGGIGADRYVCSAAMSCISTAYLGCGGNWAFGPSDPPTVALTQWSMLARAIANSTSREASELLKSHAESVRAAAQESWNCRKKPPPMGPLSMLPNGFAVAAIPPISDQQMHQQKGGLSSVGGSSWGGLALGDPDALAQPNLEWATWVLQVLMDSAESSNFERPGALSSVPPAPGSTGASNREDSGDSFRPVRDTVEAGGRVSNQGVHAVFSFRIFCGLLHAAHSPNLPLKDSVFRLCARTLGWVRLCVLHWANGPKNSCGGGCSDDTRCHVCMAPEVAAPYLQAIPLRALRKVFTARYRKEASTRVIYSSYLHSLTALLVAARRLRSLIRRVTELGRLSPSAKKQKMERKVHGNVLNTTACTYSVPSLIVHALTATSVVLAWPTVPSAPCMVRSGTTGPNKQNLHGAQHPSHSLSYATTPTSDVSEESVLGGAEMASSDSYTEEAAQCQISRDSRETDANLAISKESANILDPEAARSQPLVLKGDGELFELPRGNAELPVNPGRSSPPSSERRAIIVQCTTFPYKDDTVRSQDKLCAAVAQTESFDFYDSDSDDADSECGEVFKKLSGIPGSHAAEGDERWHTLAELSPLQTEYVVQRLEPDTRYRFRIGLKTLHITGLAEMGDTRDLPENSVEGCKTTCATEFGPPRRVNTLPEVLFTLDPDACGQHLTLSNGNLSVRNAVNKKWSAVRATTTFSHGLHMWSVQIDKCVSKNVFVGVVNANASLNNYVGSDRHGWGYLANKAIWHNKVKTRSYGELFKEGDTITVTLDMDAGTLAFARNGHDLGVAVEGLSGDLTPAFSVYNKDDQITLNRSLSSTYRSEDARMLSEVDSCGRPSVRCGMGGAGGGSALALSKVGRIAEAMDLLEVLSGKNDGIKLPSLQFPRRTLKSVASRCRAWQLASELGGRQLWRYNAVTCSGAYPDSGGLRLDAYIGPVDLLQSDEALAPFETWCGAPVQICKTGVGKILGTANGRLYFQGVSNAEHTSPPPPPLPFEERGGAWHDQREQPQSIRALAKAQEISPARADIAVLWNPQLCRILPSIRPPRGRPTGEEVDLEQRGKDLAPEASLQRRLRSLSGHEDSVNVADTSTAQGVTVKSVREDGGDDDDNNGWAALCSRMVAWTAEMDVQLVEHINNIATSRGVPPSRLAWHEVVLPSPAARPLLCGISAQRLRERVVLLLRLNDLIRDVVHLLELPWPWNVEVPHAKFTKSQTCAVGLPGRTVVEIPARSLLFRSLKFEILALVLRQTDPQHGAHAKPDHGSLDYSMANSACLKSLPTGDGELPAALQAFVASSQHRAVDQSHVNGLGSMPTAVNTTTVPPQQPTAGSLLVPDNAVHDGKAIPLITLDIGDSGSSLLSQLDSILELFPISRLRCCATAPRWTSDCSSPIALDLMAPRKNDETMSLNGFSVAAPPKGLIHDGVGIGARRSELIDSCTREIGQDRASPGDPRPFDVRFIDKQQCVAGIVPPVENSLSPPVPSLPERRRLAFVNLFELIVKETCAEAGGLGLFLPSPNSRRRGGLFSSSEFVVNRRFLYDGADAYRLPCTENGATDRVNKERRRISRSRLRLCHRLGQLIGISIRTGCAMSGFRLTPLFWKPIVGENVNLDDLTSVDSEAAALIVRLRQTDGNVKDFVQHCRAKRVLPTAGLPTGLDALGSDGSPIVLFDGVDDTACMGAEDFAKGVKCSDYADCYEQALVSEGRIVACAVRAGMCEVVPGRVLSLMCWQELAELVSGDPH